MKEHRSDYRHYVIGGVAILIVAVYIARLFQLQISSDDYKKSADSNAFLKKIEYPSRGVITDRNGKLLVYNQPAYDIMVVMNEAKDHLDTLEFCQALNISRQEFDRRMENIKDRGKNPGYSRFTQQIFMSQLSDKDFSVFQEKMFRFPGFYVQRRTIRQYQYPLAAHVLGDIAEVSQGDIEADDYYQPGDYIGKLGIERSYEKQLRGEKGIQILLRDAHGRVQGRYQSGRFDRRPVAGKNLKLGIDVELQALGERLMEGKIGSIVARAPSPPLPPPFPGGEKAAAEPHFPRHRPSAACQADDRGGPGLRRCADAAFRLPLCPDRTRQGDHQRAHHHCITHAVQDGDMEAIEEFQKAIEKFC